MKLKARDLVFWLVVLIIFLPSLFFHITNDLVVFLRGGDALVSGAKLYYDFIDIKPPFLYYFFALIRLVFGYSEIGLRLFDIIYQFLTSILLFGLCKKIKGERFGKYAVLIYAVSYTVLNYSNTLQAETLAAPFALLLIYIYLYKEGFRFYCIAGLLFCVIFSMKYTLGIIVLPFIIYDLFYLKLSLKEFLKKNLTVFSTFVVGVAVTFSILLDEQVRTGFFSVLTYLSYYGQNPPYDFAFVRGALKTSAVFFGDMYSLLFVSFIVLGLYYYFFHFSKDADKDLKFSTFIDLTILSLVLLYVSVLIERKLPVYHFARLLIWLSILSAVGLDFLANAFKSSLENFSRIKKGIVVAVACFGLAFSPLPRWVNVASYTYYYFFDKDKYNAVYAHAEKFGQYRPTLKKVANYLDSVSQKQDRILVISTGGNLINFELKDRVLTRFGQSCFYLENPGIKLWDSLFLDEFKRADFIAMQVDDNYGFLGMDLRSSYEIITQKPSFMSVLESNFEILKDFGALKVYRNKAYLLKRAEGAKQ